MLIVEATIAEYKDHAGNARFLRDGDFVRRISFVHYSEFHDTYEVTCTDGRVFPDLGPDHPIEVRYVR